MKWYLLVLKKYDELQGRACQEEFWQFVIYNLAFVGLAIAIDNILGTTAAGLPYGLFNLIYILAVIIPGVSVTIRRLHDIGKSGWFSLIILVPIIGIIWLLILLSTEGLDEDNKYGSNPKNIASLN